MNYRPPPWLLVLVFPLFPLGLLATGCGAATSASSQAPLPTSPAVVVAEPAAPTPEAATPPEATVSDVEPTTELAVSAPQPAATPHPIAAADTELPPAPIGFDDLFVNEPTGPRPVSIEIENIDIADADIIAVGVNEDSSFEVPPADQVGWYEFGPAPGEGGSAVLAAHIAYDGVDGVFRYLENVDVGSTVVIRFDDGSRQQYRIEEVTEYIKEDLPDSLFNHQGREQLALITCGGAFNYQLDSYESNTVAIAVPVG